MFISIGKNLRSSVLLKKIDIVSCEVSNDAWHALGEGIRMSKSLEKIAIHSSNLRTSVGAAEICVGLRENKTVTHVDLS